MTSADEKKHGYSSDKHQYLIDELNFLRSEYERAKAVFQVAQQEFQHALRIAQSKNRSPQDPKSGAFTNPNLDMNDNLLDDLPSAPTIDNKKIKGMFKEIAKATHPDKVLPQGNTGTDEQVERTLMFHEAKKASELNDWYTLFCIADKLGMNLEKKGQEYRNILKLTINSLKDSLGALSRDPAWLWYHSSDVMKKKIINQFIKIM